MPEEIKERPMLFNGEMVRALLDGRKTVTRRMMKPQPTVCPPDYLKPGHQWPSKVHRSMLHVEDELQNKAGGWEGIAGHACPYGEPGDRLWVRETFALLGNEDGCCIDWRDNLVGGDEQLAARIFKASCTIGDYGLWQVPDKADWKPDTDTLNYEGAWRPSIHMPRWACRILLEITAVRVERLQDITEEHALAEGVTPNSVEAYRRAGIERPAGFAFRDLWQSVYGEESWAANPWVWRVEFKRVAA